MFTNPSKYITNVYIIWTLVLNFNRRINIHIYMKSCFSNIFIPYAYRRILAINGLDTLETILEIMLPKIFVRTLFFTNWCFAIPRSNLFQQWRTISNNNAIPELEQSSSAIMELNFFAISMMSIDDFQILIIYFRTRIMIWNHKFLTYFYRHF